MSGPRATLRSALRLAACALLALALLTAIEALTRDRIDAESRRAKLAALALVLPPVLYDNDPFADAVTLRAPRWLGSDEPLRAWRARRADKASAIVLEAVAPDGYGGPIRLLVGVRIDGVVSGVRVTQHRETAGLGDGIETGRSDWIGRLAGRRLGDPPRERWTVRREGGDFDQLAGATRTPRAVLHAVRRALDYLHRHADEIYAAAPGSTLEHLDVEPH